MVNVASHTVQRHHSRPSASGAPSRVGTLFEILGAPGASPIGSVDSGAGRLKELSALVIEWMQAVRAERPEMASTPLRARGLP
jgi:hypothetical protein